MIGGALGPVTPGASVVHVGGFIALLLVVLTRTWAGSTVTVAHEGGHVVMVLISGRRVVGFVVNENSGGAETRYEGGWAVSLAFIDLAGYLTPPLLGLAGANLVLAGQSWSVLWAALILLAGALLHARGLFTNIIVVLAGVGIGWAAVGDDAGIQSLVAVTLVWWMLFGALRSLVNLRFGPPDSDAGLLARHTWIPAFVWVALFWFVAVVCLWVGGRRLLGI